MTDGLLPDVRALNGNDVRLVDGTAFDRALERILGTCGAGNFNSFNSSI